MHYHLTMIRYRCVHTVQAKTGPKRKTDIKPIAIAPCLGQLFSLSARAQRDADLTAKIQKSGPVNCVRTFAVDLAREDIIVLLTTSVATRKHCVPPDSTDKELCKAKQDVMEMRGVLAEVDGLVSENHADRFLREDGKLIHELQQYAVRSFRKLTTLLTKNEKDLLTSINKQAMKVTIGAAQTEGLRKTREGDGRDFRNSSKTDLIPGYGLLPHVAITAAEIEFDAKAWYNWATHVDNPARTYDGTRGKRARTLATEFSMLVVDRFIAEMSDYDDDEAKKALNKFEKISSALDVNGLLFEKITKDIDALSYDGKPFFTGARRAVMKDTVARAHQPASTTGDDEITPATMGGDETLSIQEDDAEPEDLHQDTRQVDTGAPGKNTRKDNVWLRRTDSVGTATTAQAAISTHVPMDALGSLGLLGADGQPAPGVNQITVLLSIRDDDDDPAELPLGAVVSPALVSADGSNNTHVGDLGSQRPDLPSQLVTSRCATLQYHMVIGRGAHFSGAAHSGPGKCHRMVPNFSNSDPFSRTLVVA